MTALRFLLSLLLTASSTLADQIGKTKPATGKNAPPARETKVAPTIYIAKGLNKDGSLLKNYKRGLDYAINYFGNYGPYCVYLLGPESEKSVRDIFRKRAERRANPQARKSIKEQVEEFLKRPNIVQEIEATLAGKSEGGLTWSGPPNRIYEDVTTNATGREKDPIENTWGALHEYHHVFQVAHVESYEERTSEKNFSSWMAEGGATYSSAKFMQNLGLVDLRDYMLQLRTSGANIDRPSINEYLAKNQNFQLDDESHWEKGSSAQIYYMLGAWATAYLIHVQGVDEKVVFKDWYFDIIPLGKSKAFKKHMGLSLKEYYPKFEAFIRQSDEEVMKIFGPAKEKEK